LVGIGAVGALVAGTSVSISSCNNSDNEDIEVAITNLHEFHIGFGSTLYLTFNASIPIGNLKHSNIKVSDENISIYIFKIKS
jgi:hypothetical protein